MASPTREAWPGLYAPLANGGAINGVRLVSPEAVTRMAKVSVATHEDATLQILPASRSAQ